MLKAQPTAKENTTDRAILRMSSAIKDAPYALDSVKMLDARVAASCGEDDLNVPRLKVASCEPTPMSPKEAASCGTFSSKAAASCVK